MSGITSEKTSVFRNDRITVGELERSKPSALIISPGPGRPEEAGITIEALRKFAGKIPILGVCLGHQAIGAAFGGSVVKARRVVHGKREPVSHDGRGLFRGMGNPSSFVRYHSLAVSEAGFPGELEVTSRSEDGEIMGLRHRTLPIEGVQFHPESAGSDGGLQIFSNFLSYRRDPFDFRNRLSSIMSRVPLSRDDAALFMEDLTDGILTDAQIGAILAALGTKGVDAAELAGCAQVLRRKRLPVNPGRPVLDTCGTGGDGMGTFNISSCAALTAAAAGAAVAKHGNRAVSSTFGSADFYQSLGIPTDLSPVQAEASLKKHGFAFLFAPLYHGALKHAAAVRRELGVKTIMNLLGPLANPAEAEYQLIGVFAPEYVRPVAEAARALGVKRGMVVHSDDGLDEISPFAPTRICSFFGSGEIRDEVFIPDPRIFSGSSGGYTMENLRSLGAEANGDEALAFMEGSGGCRPAVRDAVLLNAGAALFVYGAADSIMEGFRLARETVQKGFLKAKYREILEG